jgi:hypothetical protein
MELLIAGAAVLGLLFLLGVELMTIMSVVSVIMCILTSLMLVFFIFCLLLLLWSEKKQAEFAGLEIKQKDTPDGNGQDSGGVNKGMKFAHYIVDGQKLCNWFPAEGILTGKIYSQENCTVRIAGIGKHRLVFDRHSVVIVICGTVLMSLCTAGLIFYLMLVVNAM